MSRNKHWTGIVEGTVRTKKFTDAVARGNYENHIAGDRFTGSFEDFRDHYLPTQIETHVVFDIDRFGPFEFDGVRLPIGTEIHEGQRLKVFVGVDEDQHCKLIQILEALPSPSPTPERKLQRRPVPV